MQISVPKMVSDYTRIANESITTSFFVKLESSMNMNYLLSFFLYCSFSFHNKMRNISFSHTVDEVGLRHNVKSAVGLLGETIFNLDLTIHKHSWSQKIKTCGIDRDRTLQLMVHVALLEEEQAR